MEPEYRNIKRIILGTFLIIYSIVVIAVFLDSWKTGVMWLTAGAFLVIILRSYNRPGPRSLSRSWKILLLILFGTFFLGGAPFLPKKDYKSGKIVEEIIEPQEDTIEIDEKTVPKKFFIDSLKLNKARNKWASDVVKEWNGSYIENYKISKEGNTIYFQLTELASRNNWKIDAELHESIFQKKLDEFIDEEFSSDPNIPRTVVALIPHGQQLGTNAAINEREELILRQFSQWNGSNRYLERYIKNNINDPDCYEHIATDYVDKGEYILVISEIRTCDASGYQKRRIINAKIDLEGNILSIR